MAKVMTCDIPPLSSQVLILGINPIDVDSYVSLDAVATLAQDLRVV